MYLRSIILQNFRSFSRASFAFSARTTVIIGPNTSGKTNILEVIYLLATGKSFRASIEEEMIENGREFTRVSGSGDGMKLEVLLTRGEVAGLPAGRQGKRVGRKKLTSNKIAKRLMDYQGSFRVVLFGPWDLDLITGSPSLRRRFLDGVLFQVDREYRRAILSYEKGLRARNRLLERIREENLSRSQLLFWDRLLIRNGDYISRKREEFVEFINKREPLDKEIFEVIYDKSAISEARLAQYQEEEVAAAATLVGPHRDDIIFQITNHKSQITKNLAIYGSRGEQRMCILWVKLAELAFIENITGETPTLLLDDIFSELDHQHREIVMNIVDRQQTILTTADPHTIAGLKNVEKIELPV